MITKTDKPTKKAVHWKPSEWKLIVAAVPSQILKRPGAKLATVVHEVSLQVLPPDKHRKSVTTLPPEIVLDIHEACRAKHVHLEGATPPKEPATKVPVGEDTGASFSRLTSEAAAAESTIELAPVLQEAIAGEQEVLFKTQLMSMPADRLAYLLLDHPREDEVYETLHVLHGNPKSLDEEPIKPEEWDYVLRQLRDYRITNTVYVPKCLIVGITEHQWAAIKRKVGDVHPNTLKLYKAITVSDSGVYKEGDYQPAGPHIDTIVCWHPCPGALFQALHQDDTWNKATVKYSVSSNKDKLIADIKLMSGILHKLKRG